MADALAINWSKPIPLFPLQDCVLLPHATVPLHVFEPRYRAMMADVLDGAGLIAMATFDGEDWRADYEGKPPIRPCVCVGLVVRHEKLADGRYNLLLQGMARARVRQEIPHNPYRIALLKATEKNRAMEIDLDESRQTIESLLADPALTQLESVSAVQNWLSKEIPTVVMIDLVILTCCSDRECRYAMLAEPDVAARARWLVKMLRRQRQRLVEQEVNLPPRTDDGLGLN